jgi:hypothetical protein
MAKKQGTTRDGKKAANKPKRGPRGAFLPGNREGAAGRPQGSRNRTTQMVEALLQGEAEELTLALIKRAKAGFAVPLQLVFERILPARRDRPVQIALPPIKTVQDVMIAQSAIVQQVAAGEITPSEATSVAGLLDLKRRAIESVELEARLAALEERFQKQGKVNS